MLTTYLLLLLQKSILFFLKLQTQLDANGGVGLPSGVPSCNSTLIQLTFVDIRSWDIAYSIHQWQHHEHGSMTWTWYRTLYVQGQRNPLQMEDHGVDHWKFYIVLLWISVCCCHSILICTTPSLYSTLNSSTENRTKHFGSLFRGCSSSAKKFIARKM